MDRDKVQRLENQAGGVGGRRNKGRVLQKPHVVKYTADGAQVFCTNCPCRMKAKFLSSMTSRECRGWDSAPGQAAAKHQALFARLKERFERDTPGGHQLVWEGGTDGVIRCQRCGLGWRYVARQWKQAIVDQRCTKSRLAYEQRKVKCETFLRGKSGSHRWEADWDSWQAHCKRCDTRVVMTDGVEETIIAVASVQARDGWLAKVPETTCIRQ